LDIIAGKTGIQTGNNSPVDVSDHTRIEAGENGIQTGDNSPVTHGQTSIKAVEVGIKTGNNSPVMFATGIATEKNKQ
jgi:hypothetical protein